MPARRTKNWAKRKPRKPGLVEMVCPRGHKVIMKRGKKVKCMKCSLIDHPKPVAPPEPVPQPVSTPEGEMKA